MGSGQWSVVSCNGGRARTAIAGCRFPISAVTKLTLTSKTKLTPEWINEEWRPAVARTAGQRPAPNGRRATRTRSGNEYRQRRKGKQTKRSGRVEAERGRRRGRSSDLGRTAGSETHAERDRRSGGRWR